MWLAEGIKLSGQNKVLNYTINLTDNELIRPEGEADYGK